MQRPKPGSTRQRLVGIVRPLAALLFVCLPLALAGLVQGAAEASAVIAPRASTPVVREATFWSAALRREMPYTIYLPPGYLSGPSKRYPVVYMLHGLGGSHRQWTHVGLFKTASDLMRRGSIPPFIIVAPEGERGYWMDQVANGPRFGTYIVRDLVSMVDLTYRTIPTREARAIGGMSMGAHGALQLAFNNSDEFGAIGAHSLVLRDRNQAFPFFGDKAYFEAHDPVALALRDPATTQRFNLWVDIGDRDPWVGAATAFHQKLQAAAVPHAWHVYPGGHDDAYWKAHGGDYLRFYGGALRYASAPIGKAQRTPRSDAPAP